MEAIDRRSALRGMLCVVVAAGCSTSLLPTDAKAVPLAQSKDAAAAAPAHNLKQPAQAVTSRPPSRPVPDRHRRRRRRRRRWVCYWRRGRRVCGWRWI
jgi:hypothetical protein